MKLLIALCEKLGFEVKYTEETRLTGEVVSGHDYSTKEFMRRFPDKVLADHKTPGYKYDGHFHIAETIKTFELVEKV